MSRYIDADRLLNDLKADALYPLVEKYGIERVIDAQPTADVVEVVRCKDCKWFEAGDSEDYGRCSGKIRLGNDYCSFGEREES